MKSFCMYGEAIAEVLGGERIKGGMELQTALLAKALARNGVDVTIVDPLLAEVSQPMDHLTLRPVEDWHRGVRGIRLFQYRIPGALRTLKATGASAFYARGYSYRFLLPLLAARQTGATFILAIASDTDLLGFRARYRKSYRGGAGLWTWVSTIIPNEIGGFFLRRLADYLFVQHAEQAELARARGLSRSRGRAGGDRVVQFNNLLDEEALACVQGAPSRSGNILMVGTISLPKGIRLLVPLIDRLPQVTFEFVGKATDTEGEEVLRLLRQRPNVVLDGPLSRIATLEKIASARALLNTSPKEGFPNTFLEAWALRTPVISLFVDPGGVMRAHDLGYVCNGNLGRLEELLQRSRYDIDLERIRAYAMEHHSSRYALQVLDALAREAA